MKKIKTKASNKKVVVNIKNILNLSIKVSYIERREMGMHE